MTEFIFGSSGSGKGTYIVNKIKEKLGLGKRLYLIVPEQQAVVWEERICRELPPSAALELEVLSFRRLANTVARQVGGLAYNYSGDGRKLLLMWSAIAAVKDSLTVYAGTEGREDRYISLMLETVGTLRQNRISPEALVTASEKLTGEEHKSLRERLSDIALIYSAYKTVRENDETEDPEDILDNMEITLRTNEFFRDSFVFIDSFFSLTPVETEILYHMMRTAEGTYITFNFLPSCRDIHFEHIRRHYKTVKRLADAAGCETNTVILDKNKRTEKESLLHLEKNLWNFSAHTIEAVDNSVKIITCADRYEEARAVGAEIERLVHEGASYSDIAVIARDVSALSGILDSRLEALGIPFHTAKRQEISSSPAVKFITSLFDTVSGGYKREKIVSLLKTGLCPVSTRECANFEEYTAKWNLRGRKAFLDSELWSMNPAGYTKELSPWGKTVLLDANKVKKTMASPLTKLDSLFEYGKAPVFEICRTVYEILCDFNVYDSLMDRAEALRENNKEREALETEKLFEAILEVLDTMAETVGGCLMDAGKFSRLFFAVAKTLDIGSIPDGIDAVIFGSAFGVRSGEIKHVIMPGCIEGEFPMSVKNTGFFSDLDKLILEGVGINMGDNCAAMTGEELFRFWRTVTMASESVTLIVPASNGGAKASPSMGAVRIKKLLSLEDTPFSEIEKKDVIWSENSAADTLPYLSGTPDYDTVLSLGNEYPKILKNKNLAGKLGAENDKLSPEISDKVWGNRLALTQSRIDLFTKCRFKYYMDYVVKLEASERATVNAVDVGNLVHKVLELFFAEVKGRPLPIPLTETEEITDRILSEYINEIMSGSTLSSRQDYLLSRLRRNVLAILDILMKEFADSKFAPRFFELSMRGTDENCPIPLTFDCDSGAKVSLHGVIDRVDTYEDDENVYVRVVDYKTGKKVFRRSDIAKGQNLQLLIYLFTLWKGESCAFRDKLTGGTKKIIPAAAMYFSAPPDAGKSENYLTDGSGVSLAQSAIDRTGLFLNDEKILSAMDSDGNNKYIPYKTKKGKIDPKKVSTLEEFDAIFEETKDVIRKIAGDMKSGDCGAAPSQKGDNAPCRYCSLKPVCRHIEGPYGKETDDE